MLKGIIFDMDGVIIDSEPSHARAAINALKSLGVSITLDYPYRFIGSTTEHMLNTMIYDFKLEISLQELHELYKESLAALIREEGYIEIPYVKELIKHLRECGYSLAIASSSTPEEIQSVTEALKITSCFDRLVSGATVLHPKPAPDVFLKAVSELGLTVEECIIIEDSSNGVKAACAAGIPVIGYVNPNSGRQDLSRADILVEGFDEIDGVFLEKIYCRHHGLPAAITESERLFIREIPVSDISLLMEIYKDPLVHKFLPEIYEAALDSTETAAQRHRAYIHNIYHFYGYGLWGIYLKETGRLIGQCGIESKKHGTRDYMEIGYLLDSNYRHQGYGLEAVKAVVEYAFGNLDINKLTAFLHPSNTASAALLKKAGFQYVQQAPHGNPPYDQYEIQK